MASLFLEGALGSRAKVQILRLLSNSPRRRVSGNAVAKEIGMSPNTVHRALKELIDAGIVEVSIGPTSHDVCLAKNDGLTQALKELYRKEAELCSNTVAAIRKALPPDVAALVFGSVARGTANLESDLDIVIVAPDHDRAAEASMIARRAARQVLPLPLQAIHLTPAELRAKWGSPWLRRACKEGVPATRKKLEDFL